MKSEVMDLKLKDFYPDREFFTVEVINYLKNRKIPFIIPCVKRRRSGGIRKLLKGRKSYSTENTMCSKEDEATFQVNVVAKYSKDKYKEKGVKLFAYAVYNMDLPIENTFKEYRKRFGYRIHLPTNESSTNTHQQEKKPVLRLLYVGLSFLLVNIWIYIQWTYLSILRQGGRQRVAWTFKTMLRQINRESEVKLGFSNKITI
ncbi:MAG: hypothetical protein LBC39_06525 [Methanobrevibacter sp.]|jgi:putative transposase|nr:hypothetical protein [Candidatus Methanovirga aequatorialis]